MAAIETILGFATAPGAFPGVAVTMATGQSNQVRYFSQGKAYLMNAAKNSVSAIGGFRVTSPRLHDANQGITLQVPFQDVGSRWPLGTIQPLVSQDTLTINDYGTAVGGEIEQVGLTIYYDYLDSAPARLLTPQEVDDRTQNVFTIRNSVAAGVAGGWSGSTALSAVTSGDLTYANTDYALIGATGVGTAAANNNFFLGVQGIDTGNLIIGLPVSANDPTTSARYFRHLSEFSGRACIPVINSANKGGTFIYVGNTSVANTTVYSLIFAQLR